MKAKLMMIMIIAALMAGGWKEDQLLPISAIKPGMTSEEIMLIEPDANLENGYYNLTINYKGVLFSGMFSNNRITNRIGDIYWTTLPVGDIADIEKLGIEIEDYCNKRYDVVFDMEVSDNNNKATGWVTEGYRISLFHHRDNQDYSFMITISEED